MPLFNGSLLSFCFSLFLYRPPFRALFELRKVVGAGGRMRMRNLWSSRPASPSPALHPIGPLPYEGFNLLFPLNPPSPSTLTNSPTPLFRVCSLFKSHRTQKSSAGKSALAETAKFYGDRISAIGSVDLRFSSLAVSSSNEFFLRWIDVRQNYPIIFVRLVGLYQYLYLCTCVVAWCAWSIFLVPQCVTDLIRSIYYGDVLNLLQFTAA